MKFLVVALAIISVCAAQSDADWERYQREYGKLYRSADENNNRRAIWEKNWSRIKSHNEKFAKGEVSYTMGENQFADMTFEEFSKEKLGLNPSALNPKFIGEHVVDPTRVTKPAHDLRTLGYVQSVRDQGRCGGCWAFSVAATIEVLFIKNGKYSNSVDLSEQHLVDCSKALLLGIIRRNNGCNGGQIQATYDDVKNMGIVDEVDYPYTASNGTCKSVTAKNKISGYVAVSTDKAVVDAIELGNAVAVAMAVSDGFQLYKNGVYYGNATENAAGLNHAVVAIGYDVTTGKDPHYIIRNSWSEKWGESGYFRIAHGHLGIPSTMAGYPKL